MKGFGAPATQKTTAQHGGPGRAPATLVTFLAESDPVRRTKVILENGVKEGNTPPKINLLRSVRRRNCKDRTGKLMVFA